MTSIRNEPGLAPSAATGAEKKERVRAGKGLASVIGVIALIFIVACFGIIAYWFSLPRVEAILAIEPVQGSSAQLSPLA